ncbi:MAG: hypothetical protein JO332_03320, partial [Planctomycetaceae bacterium]|nr:hypothetical protein [Planctomycetaceae bacterium]
MTGTRRTVCFVLFLLLGGCKTLNRVGLWKRPDFKVYHLGNAEQPEWLDLNKTPVDGRDLNHVFVLEETPSSEATLLLWQNNVKYAWSVAVNGRKLGQLALYEIPVVTPLAVPSGLLKKGENTLTLTAPKENDEILVGLIRVEPRP